MVKQSNSYCVITGIKVMQKKSKNDLTVTTRHFFSQHEALVIYKVRIAGRVTTFADVITMWLLLSYYYLSYVTVLGV